MPVGDSIIIEGNAADGVRELMRRLSDYSMLLPKLGTIAKDAQQQHIEQGRDIFGVTFKDLAPSTIRARGEGHPYGDTPLLDTTAMYQSIHFEERSAAEVFAGPDPLLDYFTSVNQGTARGIPARTFIGLNNEDTQNLGDAVYEWAGGILN